MATTTTHLLTFQTPPFPFFIEGNQMTYCPGEQHPRRKHVGIFDILFVKEGVLYIEEDGQHWEIGENELLVLRPDSIQQSFRACEVETVFEWFHFQTVAPWEEIKDHESSRIHGDYYNYAITIPKHMNLKESQQILFSLEKLLDHSNGDSGSPFWNIQLNFLEFLQAVDREWRHDLAKASVAVADRAADYLKAHYQTPISNKQLSHHLGLHINYITRSMTEVFGCTPQQYLLYYRIDQAKLHLLKTDWSIAHIASVTGFKQTPHFSRLFSAQVGMSPLKFRKRFT